MITAPESKWKTIAKITRKKVRSAIPEEKKCKCINTAIKKKSNPANEQLLYCKHRYFTLHCININQKILRNRTSDRWSGEATLLRNQREPDRAKICKLAEMRKWIDHINIQKKTRWKKWSKKKEIYAEYQKMWKPCRFQAQSNLAQLFPSHWCSRSG